MNKEVEAFDKGYKQAMQDLQLDISENMILEKVEFIYVDAKKRTAEFAKTLNLEDG